MRFIKNFENFNDLLTEVRLSDVLNLKSKEDTTLGSEIDQLKNLSFDFEKSLVKFITLKKRVNNENEFQKELLSKQYKNLITFLKI